MVSVLVLGFGEEDAFEFDCPDSAVFTPSSSNGVAPSIMLKEKKEKLERNWKFLFRWTKRKADSI